MVQKEPLATLTVFAGLSIEQWREGVAQVEVVIARFCCLRRWWHSTGSAKTERALMSRQSGTRQCVRDVAMNAQEPELRYQCEDLDGNRSPSANERSSRARQDTTRPFDGMSSRPLEAEWCERFQMKNRLLPHNPIEQRSIHMMLSVARFLLQTPMGAQTNVQTQMNRNNSLTNMT